MSFIDWVILIITIALVILLGYRLFVKRTSACSNCSELKKCNTDVYNELRDYLNKENKSSCH